MDRHHAIETAWAGFYEYEDTKRRDEMEFKSLIIDNATVKGAGEDSVGKFLLEGTKTNDTIKFDKNYVGAHTVVYQGRISDFGEGQKIVGKWHIQAAPEVEGAFELTRSLELERKREAAFLMVVARMKMWVGLVRFFFEDVGFSLLQGLFLTRQVGLDGNTRNFTVLSLAVGLFVSIAGPIMDWLDSRRLLKEGGDAADPGPPPSVDGGKVAKQAQQGYAVVAPAEEQEQSIADEGYKRRVEKAKEMTRMEFLSGNKDYVEILMERPDRPAEVPDIAITDVIVTSSGIHRILCLVVLLYWSFVLSVPFAFKLTCQAGVPAKAHLCFMWVSFLSLFAQIWVAAVTKYGYLTLVHSPQRFAFSLLLSFMGNFDSYSDIAFVTVARDCGSWIWMPAAFLYFGGVVLAQALPGMLFLVFKINIPAALKLTELQVLLALLKPSVN